MTVTREPILVEQQPPIDLRPLLAKTAELQERLEDRFETARRVLSQQPPTVEQIIAFLENEARYMDWEPRHLGKRAGALVGIFDNVLGALGEAKAHHAANADALAAHKRALAALETQTSVRSAGLATAARNRIGPLRGDDNDLQRVIDSVEAMVPAITADVSRFVWACGVVARRIRHARIIGALAEARRLIAVVAFLRAADDEHPLLALVDRFPGQNVGLPELEWPNSTDVFAPPTLG